MSWEALVARLLPGAIKLAFDAVQAIARGDVEAAKRKAEEAARRQAVKLAVDATLRAKAKK